MGLDFPVFGVVTDLRNFFYYAFNGVFSLIFLCFHILTDRQGVNSLV